MDTEMYVPASTDDSQRQHPTNNIFSELLILSFQSDCVGNYQYVKQAIQPATIQLDAR